MGLHLSSVTSQPSVDHAAPILTPLRVPTNNVRRPSSPECALLTPHSSSLILTPPHSTHLSSFCSPPFLAPLRSDAPIKYDSTRGIVVINHKAAAMQGQVADNMLTEDVMRRFHRFVENPAVLVVHHKAVARLHAITQQRRTTQAAMSATIETEEKRQVEAVDAWRHRELKKKKEALQRSLDADVRAIRASHRRTIDLEGQKLSAIARRKESIIREFFTMEKAAATGMVRAYEEKYDAVLEAAEKADLGVVDVLPEKYLAHLLVLADFLEVDVLRDACMRRLALPGMMCGRVTASQFPFRSSVPLLQEVTVRSLVQSLHSADLVALCDLGVDQFYHSHLARRELKARRWEEQSRIDRMSNDELHHLLRSWEDADRSRDVGRGQESLRAGHGGTASSPVGRLADADTQERKDGGAGEGGEGERDHAFLAELEQRLFQSAGLGGGVDGNNGGGCGGGGGGGAVLLPFPDILYAEVTQRRDFDVCVLNVELSQDPKSASQSGKGTPKQHHRSTGSKQSPLGSNGGGGSGSGSGSGSGGPILDFTLDRLSAKLLRPFKYATVLGTRPRTSTQFGRWVFEVTVEALPPRGASISIGFDVPRSTLSWQGRRRSLQLDGEALNGRERENDDPEGTSMPSAPRGAMKVPGVVGERGIVLPGLTPIASDDGRHQFGYVWQSDGQREESLPSDPRRPGEEGGQEGGGMGGPASPEGGHGMLFPAPREVIASCGMLHVGGESHSVASTFKQGDVITVGLDQEASSPRVYFMCNGVPCAVPRSVQWRSCQRTALPTDSEDFLGPGICIDNPDDYELLPAICMYSARQHNDKMCRVRANFSGPFQFPIPGFEGLGSEWQGAAKDEDDD